MLHVRSKLYLGLKSTKLTCLLEGDRVRAIQDVIPSLKYMKKEEIQGPGRGHISPSDISLTQDRCCRHEGTVNTGEGRNTAKRKEVVCAPPKEGNSTTGTWVINQSINQSPLLII